MFRRTAEQLAFTPKGILGTCMDVVQKIETLIEPALADMGYELVRVRVTGSQRKTLQIMADRLDGAAMGVEDCADISHATSAILDVEDPITDAYVLEVSSPGIDRPLTKLHHFERYAGFEAKVEMHHMIDGRKRFSGRLLGVEDDKVRLEHDGSPVDLPFAEIRNAKLILTDELIAAAQSASDGDENAVEGGMMEVKEVSG